MHKNGIKNNLSLLVITESVKLVIQTSSLSTKGLVNETVIVKSVSTDTTDELTRGVTERVYTHPFHNDFSEIRNFGLSKVSGDWVLVLDTDERLSQEAGKQIPKLIKNQDVDGYWFRRKTFISPDRYLRYGLFYPDWQLRLFRNKKQYRYVGAVHERLTIPKGKTKEVPYDILHFPTYPKYDRFSSFKNLMPYVRIHAKELAQSDKSALALFGEGWGNFFELFFGGFVRGKGFMDGWAGFRAHLMFAVSIALAYFRAALKL